MDENNVATIIGPGTTVKGELVSKGTVRIEGAVEGRVECEDTVVVHESGQVKADLEAAQIIISGVLEGNAMATERLEITNHGKVVGNITSPRISIAEGVIFEGQCTMKPPTKLKAIEPTPIKGAKGGQDQAQKAAS